MASALAAHRAGRLDQAEPLYRDLLAAEPDHAEGLHLLGVLLHQTGRHQPAADLIARALDRDGANADYHNNRGEVCRALGRADEAAVHFPRLASVHPQAASFRQGWTWICQKSRGNSEPCARYGPFA